MNVLLILNDPPYGTERSYNGLRLALALAKVEGTTVRVFLMADAVACAKPGQTTPEGYYNIGRMLKGLTSQGRRGRHLRFVHGRPRLHGRRPRRGHLSLVDGAACRMDAGRRQGRHVLTSVSRIRTRTTRPEAAVNAATAAMAGGIPSASAITPATSAPIAKPRSRHRR